MQYAETSSPGMLLLFVGAFLWMIMGIRFRDLSAVQKWAAPILILTLAVFNEWLRIQFDMAFVRKIFLLTMQLPFFLIFLYLAKYGPLKTLFAIFSAMIFSSPPTIAIRAIRYIVPTGAWTAYFFDAACYALTLLLTRLIFRRGFNYLFKYSDNKIFIPFYLVGALYYVYTFALWKFDLTAFQGVYGILVRYLPTMQVFMFYFSLLQSYQDLSEKRELEASQAALSLELDAAEDQIARLDEAHRQSALYRHDMRHHLTAISGFLAEGNPRQAEEYIQKVSSGIDAITPRRFCENHLVNLLCSSFVNRAENAGISLSVEAGLPEAVPLPDTELCAMLSNGLENALNATAGLEEARRWIRFYCGIRTGQLLLEIQNPYDGPVVLRDGLPVSGQEGHGHGCRSIRAIAGRNQGLCEFAPEDGVFTLRVVLPVQNR